MGGRHRAAIGITERTDAVGLVVSEETGSISLASAGKLIRGIDMDTLGEMLENFLQPPPPLSKAVRIRGAAGG